MQSYEYKIVPAPKKAKRARGAKTVPDRFARTLTDVINAEAAEGWEYLRAESLPVEEKKSMLSATAERYFSVLVLRRDIRPTGRPIPSRAANRYDLAEEPEVMKPRTVPAVPLDD